jgi:hypothetical protein
MKWLQYIQYPQCKVKKWHFYSQELHGNSLNFTQFTHFTYLAPLPVINLNLCTYSMSELHYYLRKYTFCKRIVLNVVYCWNLTRSCHRYVTSGFICS